jgi:hypothetical protein
LNISRIAGPFFLSLFFLGTSFGMAAAEKESTKTTATSEKEVIQDRSKPPGPAQKQPEGTGVTKEAVDVAIEKARTALDAFKKRLAPGSDTSTDDRMQRRMDRTAKRAERSIDMAVKHKERGELEMALSEAKRALGDVERVQRVQNRPSRGSVRQEARPEKPGKQIEKTGEQSEQPSSNSKGGEK